MSENKKVTGYSLSKCIQDIAEGEVEIEQVSKIVAGTNCSTKEGWKYVLGVYLRTCWRRYPLKAIKIFYQLKNSDRISQPRTENLSPPDVSQKVFWREDNEK